MATAAQAGIGHNNPPEDEEPKVLTPYETMKIHIDDLFLEASNFLDGAPITTQEMADAVDAIKAQAIEAEKAGEELRKAEAKPFDDGKKAVQEKWNPLVHKDTGRCRQIVSTCAKAITPFLKAKQDAIDAEAERQRKIAADLAAEALRAHQEASPTNLADTVAAEDALRLAADSYKAADRIANTRAQAKGGKRATSLRDVWTPVLIDPVEALKHYRSTQPEALKEWLRAQAEKDVASGSRAIPGFAIKHDRIAK